VTFSSSQLLKEVSDALALSMLVALPPEFMLLMFLVLGPLQGTHRSAHFGYLVYCILTPMPLLFRLHSGKFLPSGLALPTECSALLAIPILLLLLGAIEWLQRASPLGSQLSLLPSVPILAWSEVLE
jgi:hypothetical protein